MRRPQSAYAQGLRKPKGKTDGVLAQLENQSYRLERPRRQSTRFVYKDPPKYTAKEDMLKKEMSAPEYTEQREVLRRVALAKGTSDFSAPKTFGRAAQMSKNRQLKASQHEKSEHLRELTSLKQRLGSVGTWQHRKKNPADPLANPVWFFKGKNRDPDSEKLLGLDAFEQRLKEHTRKEKQEMEELYREIEEEVFIETTKKDKLRREGKRKAEEAKSKKDEEDKERGNERVQAKIDSMLESAPVKPWADFSQKNLRKKYQNSWKAQIVTRDDTANSNVHDYQKLSNDIRPANTIYKERPQTDYFKSKDDRDDDED